MTFDADTRGATREFAEPFHAGIYGGRSLWWRWTAPNTGRARLITMPRTSLGFQLAVYRGDSLTTLAPVAALSFPEYGGELEFNAQAGVEYRIALDGTHGIEPLAYVELRVEGDLAVPQFTSFERRTDGVLQLSVRASPGAAFVLESSEDVQGWSTEHRGTVGFIGAESIQLPITAVAQKFFRVRTD